MPSATRLPSFWIPAVLVVTYAIVLLLIALLWHKIPLYGVETDFVSEYAPAAHELLSGKIVAEHYDTKGVGYPLLLSVATRVVGGNDYLAAQLLGIASASVGAWIAFLLICGSLGESVALSALLFLLVNPAYIRAAIELGTDMPAFALSIAATYLVITHDRPITLAAAGLVAGYAVITRYNAGFLLPAALFVLLRRPNTVRAVFWYGLGAALPICGWLLIAYLHNGHVLNNTNYFNLAYALYGDGAEWDRFWATSGSRFHSFADVISYDPAEALRRVGVNIATHWMHDVRELMPLLIGVVAVAGMILYCREARHRMALSVHFGACYLTLATIFYSPRFFIYLLPFYLAGAGAYIIGLPRAVAEEGTRVARSAPVSRWRWGLIGIFIGVSGVQVVADLRAMERNAPVEIIEASDYLRRVAPKSATIMARKPHVAYFAHMGYVPMPWAVRVADVIDAGRRARASFLFFSGLEENTRPQLAVLSVEGAQFPGLHQELWRATRAGRFFAIYRFTGEPVDSAIMARQLRWALEKRLESDPNNASLRLEVAGILMNERSYAAALIQLRAAEHLSPNEPQVAVLQAISYQAIGDQARSLTACERALQLHPTTAFQHGEIGLVLYQQRDFVRAIEQLRVAVQLEPSHALYLAALGSSHFETGEYGFAAAELERALAIVPQARHTRLDAARSYLFSGRPAKSLALIADGSEKGFTSPALEALADSIRSLRKRADPR